MGTCAQEPFLGFPGEEWSKQVIGLGLASLNGISRLWSGRAALRCLMPGPGVEGVGWGVMRESSVVQGAGRGVRSGLLGEPGKRAFTGELSAVSKDWLEASPNPSQQGPTCQSINIESKKI